MGQISVNNSAEKRIGEEKNKILDL